MVTPAVLTVKEAAEYLATSVDHIYRLTREARIPHTKVGGKLRFKRERLDEWLDSNTVE